MPGFAVAEFTDRMKANSQATSRANYYYNYTWYVPSILTNVNERNTSLIHLKEATLPSFTVNVEKYVGGSMEYKYAKSVSWDDIKLSWYDTEGLLQYVRRWRESVWSSQYGLRPAAEYQFTTDLVSYLPNGGGEQGWRLESSWPSSIKYGDLTYSSSDIKAVEITLAYDYAAEFVGLKELKNVFFDVFGLRP
jgi:hypothetical protein